MRRPPPALRRRRSCRSILPALTLLVAGALAAACAAPHPMAAPPGRADAARLLSERAAVLGGFVRGAMACGMPVSATAQDRAAAIETAALDLHQREGGRAARDAVLQAMQPPAFDPRQRGRDRDAWCVRRREDARRVAAWLESEEGAAFAREAEAASR